MTTDALDGGDGGVPCSTGAGLVVEATIHVLEGEAGARLARSQGKALAAVLAAVSPSPQEEHR